MNCAPVTIDVSDGLWARIEPYLPARDKAGTPLTSSVAPGRKPKSARLIFEAIAHALLNDIPWKALPKERFGSASAVHARFGEWRKAGFFDQLLASGVLDGSPLADIHWPMQSQQDLESESTEDSYLPEVYARRRERVRQRILAAASALFEENGGEDGGGFEQTTVEAIASRAQVSTRTFFRYFYAKGDAIYLDRRFFDEWYETLLSRLAKSPPSAGECLAVYLDDYRKFTSAKVNRDRIRRSYLSINFAAGREAFAASIRETVKRWTRPGFPAGLAGDIRTNRHAGIVASIADSINATWAENRALTTHRDLLRIIESVVGEFAGSDPWINA